MDHCRAPGQQIISISKPDHSKNSLVLQVVPTGKQTNEVWGFKNQQCYVKFGEIGYEDVMCKKKERLENR